MPFEGLDGEGEGLRRTVASGAAAAVPTRGEEPLLGASTSSST